MMATDPTTRPAVTRRVPASAARRRFEHPTLVLTPSELEFATTLPGFVVMHGFDMREQTLEIVVSGTERSTYPLVELIAMMREADFRPSGRWTPPMGSREQDKMQLACIEAVMTMGH